MYNLVNNYIISPLKMKFFHDLINWKPFKEIKDMIKHKSILALSIIILKLYLLKRSMSILKFNKDRSTKSSINGSYALDVDLKQYEMTSLQSQINPHFLYNTLEAIRMKAVDSGDKEISKMIYIMSTLFRNQLKEENTIPMSKELAYCDEYVELFRIRYDGKFKFLIDCSDDFKDVKIPKFTIQPLVENYFIHGIRLDDIDNVLRINVSCEDGLVLVKVMDNGYGLSDDQRDEVNHMIRNKVWARGSMGLFNVHRRIVLEYGEDYGLFLTKGYNDENSITIKIPCRGA